jgi:HEAT repeat protein
MLAMLLLLFACDGSTGTATGGSRPASAPAKGEPPPAAEAQAARAAPSVAADWQGAWTLALYANDPSDPACVAMAGALGLPLSAWSGSRPPTRPGEAAVVWIPAGTDIRKLGEALAPRPGPGGPGGGEVVLVLGPGDDAWRTRAAAELPWASVAVVDPTISLSLWASPSRAVQEPKLAGLVTALTLSEHYAVAYHAAAGSFPPGLAQVLGPADPAALTSPDPVVRAEAARRGGADTLAGDPEAAVRLGVAVSTTDQAVLARLATDPEPLVRARVADRLDDIAILGRLAKDPSSVVRVVATHRLAHAGDPAAQPILREAAASPDAYQRWKAASGLDDVALLDHLLADVDIDVRREAARRLGVVGKAGSASEAVTALTRAVRDDNSFVRRWAAGALGKIGDPSAIPALREVARDPTALVADAAAKSLGALGQPAPGVPFQPHPKPKDDAELDSWLASPDATVRKDASKFLAGREDAATKLAKLVADKDSEVRKSAVEALGWSDGNTATLLAALHDPDPDVEVTALDALRRSRSGDVPAIAALLANPDTEIRLRAAEALATLGPSDALAGCLKDPDERIRAAAVSVYPDRVDPHEPAALVRRAAAVARRPAAASGHDALVDTAEGTDADAWAMGVFAREDDLVHLRFSWNDPSDRPASYRALRPPVIRQYGHPDRG